MKTIVSIALLAFVLAFGAFGQTSVIDVGTAPQVEPQYSAAAGLGFDGYSALKFTGWAAFETRIADKTTNLSILNMTSAGASITTGVKRTFYQSGPVSLFALALAGLETGSGTTAATFAGGGGIKLALDKNKIPLLKMFTSIPGSYFVGSMTAKQLNGSGVAPAFSAGFGVDFR